MSTDKTDKYAQARAVMTPQKLKRCKSCWWQEGRLCYKNKKDAVGEAVDDERFANCEEQSWYWSKRQALGSIIPMDKLVITSELTK